MEDLPRLEGNSRSFGVGSSYEYRFIIKKKKRWEMRDKPNSLFFLIEILCGPIMRLPHLAHSWCYDRAVFTFTFACLCSVSSAKINRPASLSMNLDVAALPQATKHHRLALQTKWYLFMYYLKQTVRYKNPGTEFPALLFLKQRAQTQVLLLGHVWPFPELFHYIEYPDISYN